MLATGAAYQGSKHLVSEEREKLRTVARVPIIGQPSGWPRQKFCASTSCATASGLSSSMRISSRITCFSLAISSVAKSGCSTMSDSTSNASGRCPPNTRELKHVASFDVNASSMPPTESTSRAICSAERRSVPLNTMCSMKCAMPLSAAGSRREPARSHIPMDTERACGIGSTTSTRPFGKTCRTIGGGTFFILFFTPG
jgi:hypothetical protein